ncbi:MAG TPA: hypothetical protein VFH68_06225 [Polyangia bacterium]|nr:hypothetical protein [Polyangia bacterium]
MGTQTALALQNWVDGQGVVALQPPEHMTVSAQRLLAQGMVVAEVQLPAPLHTVAVVALPFAHDPGAHWVNPPGKLHLVPSAPPQVPLQGAVPAHAARVPRGFPVTGVHLPARPASLQLSHWPAHALSQHTPSMQLPFEHSAAVMHVAPLTFFGRHIPVASQNVPAAHGFAVLHMSKQLVTSAH